MKFYKILLAALVVIPVVPIVIACVGLTQVKGQNLCAMTDTVISKVEKTVNEKGEHHIEHTTLYCEVVNPELGAVMLVAKTITDGVEGRLTFIASLEDGEMVLRDVTVVVSNANPKEIKIALPKPDGLLEL